jgi:MFS family permease
MGAPTHLLGLSGDSCCILCRSCFDPNKRILVVAPSASHPGWWLRQHNRSRFALRLHPSRIFVLTDPSGAGVIGDISTPEERGGFFGMFNLGPMVSCFEAVCAGPRVLMQPQLAPCVGPVLGGVLSDKLGWRSIMWFLAIFSGVCFFIVLL